MRLTRLNSGLAVLLLVSVSAPALSTTILVPGNQPTIQAGLNAAVNGDTVLVAPGTYTGASNRNLDFAGKAIVLRSSAGAATTIIDCQNVARGFRFHSNETALSVVDGFTIRNANDGGAGGGGMSIEDASPTIRNCVFTANHGINGAGVVLTGGSPLFTACQFTGCSAINAGGAVYAADGTSGPSFFGCTIAQNTAPFGGGMYFGGSSSSVTLTGCTFTANSAVSHGAGIFFHGSALNMKRCTWSQNTAKRGAGLYCEAGASAAIDSCSFTMNTASESGGGAFCDNPFSVSLTHTDFTGNRTVTVATLNSGGGLYCFSTDAFLMADCTFTGNTVVGTGQGGGAFYRAGPTVDVVRCTFTGNSASTGGGAAMFNVTFQDCEFTDNTALGGGGGLSAPLSPAIVQCTFTRNHAAYGGGVIAQGELPGVIQDCTFDGNTAGTGGGVFRNGPVDISSSLFHGNSAGAGGAIYCAIVLGPGQSHISDCTIYDNSAGLGSALYIDGPNPPDPPLGLTTVTQCTIAYNRSGPSLLLKSPVTLSRSIIAFGDNGEALGCMGNGLAALSCTDSFGNAGGNWTGCISDQLGINGNFAADPRFCSPPTGNYTLAADSPCAPAHSPAGCGTIGSQPVGCVTPIGIADAASPTATPHLRILPNPLRQGGTIEWSDLPAGAQALSLYDAAGRLVLRHDLAPGTQGTRGRLSWSDLVSGQRLPPGVYFLRSLAPLGMKLADETVIILP